MSHRPTARESHEAAEDHRNEAAARVRALVRHEEEVRRLTYKHWCGRIQPLMATASRPSDDFEGCTE